MLQKNFNQGHDNKVYGDLLIPRTILKRNVADGVKQKRFQEAVKQYVEYQNSKIGNNDSIGEYDAVFGKNLTPDDPLLEPKKKVWADIKLK